MKLVARHYRTGVAYEFRLDGQDIERRGGSTRATDYVFGPGLIDLQSNGYAGIDFNNPDTTPEETCLAIRAMWKDGCTSVLPTIITNDPDRIALLLKILVMARNLDRDVRASMPGIHLEGPFISPIDGARGAHPREYICEPSVSLWNRWQSAASGLIRMVTLAPEIPGGIAFARQLTRQGVVVAIGHTMAGVPEISKAVNAGARVSTHLGNGCPAFLQRHDNPVLAQLGEDRLSATFIPDGIHLPKHVLKTFVRAKSAARSIVVTDAMAAAGAPPGRYTLAGHELEVGLDRVVRQLGQTNFAGSALTMANAVANFASFTGLSLGEAWNAGSARPASLLGIRDRSVFIAARTESKLRPIAVARGSQVLWLNSKTDERG